MRKAILLAVVLNVLVVIANVTKVYAADYLNSTNNSSEIEKTIDEYVDRYIEKSTIGAEIGVVSEGKTVFQKAYGYADYEAKKKLQNNMMMEWASVTKLFVWVSAMQLYEQGKLELESDVRKYLSNDFLESAGLDKVKPFSMLDLMNHTSGLEDAVMDLGFPSEEYLTSLKDALISAEVDQIYDPGTVMHYSNYGAALAGYVIEVISGEDFYTYVEKNIFDVLDMKNAFINPRLSDEVKSQKAAGYTYTPDPDVGFEKSIWTYVSLYPCGSLNSTMEDMVKFANALLPAKGEKSPLFKEKDTLDLMFETTYAIAEGESGMAHGFFEYGKNPNVYMHNGNSIAFSSAFGLDIKNRKAVLIVTNQANEFDIISGLFDKLLVDDQYVSVGMKDIDYSSLTWQSSYVPARYVEDGYLRFYREMAFYSINSISKDAVVLSQLGNQLTFQNVNGNYMYDGNELILGIKNNEVTHFQFNNTEFVPAKSGRSELPWLVNFGIVALCAVSFFIAFIVRAVMFVSKKKNGDAVESSFIVAWIMNATKAAIIINIVLLVSNSMPWPVLDSVKKYIVINWGLAILLAAELLFYLIVPLIMKNQFKIVRVLPVLTGAVIIFEMFYWNLFTYA